MTSPPSPSLHRGQPTEGRVYLVREGDRNAAVMIWRDEYTYVYDPASQHFRPSPAFFDAVMGFDLNASAELYELDNVAAAGMLRSGLGPAAGAFDGETGEGIAAADVVPGLQRLAPKLTPRQRAAAFAAMLGATDEWVDYKTYPLERSNNAYAAANQLRAGKIKALGVVDATIERREGEIAVLIRAAA